MPGVSATRYRDEGPIEIDGETAHRKATAEPHAYARSALILDGPNNQRNETSMPIHTARGGDGTGARVPQSGAVDPQPHVALARAAEPHRLEAALLKRLGHFVRRNKERFQCERRSGRIMPFGRGPTSRPISARRGRVFRFQPRSVLPPASAAILTASTISR